jgi:outer membrane murein-binding lipoprotein Lpp
MLNPLFTRTILATAIAGVMTAGLSPTVLASEDDLKARIAQLERELAAAKAELQAAETERSEAEAELAEARDTMDQANDLGPKKIELLDGRLKIGGAIRANYAIGDYGESANGAPSRAWEDNGNFNLDTFRINMDYADGPLLGKLEYRWYDGYNFLHTGWLGYAFDDDSQLQVGVNRVPFGPGPYGISQSYFFDQHYYMGLSDDMDLGIKYTRPIGDWAFDFAYYHSDEGNYNGGSRDSARYSYDVVNESGNGYEERNQFNLRGIHSFTGSVPTDLGFSLQYGQLESKGMQDDGDHYAASVHMINKWNSFTLGTQLTYFDHDVDAAQPLGTDQLVQFGAYDFPSTAAATGWIPAISLSYYQATPGIAWLDYVIPYVEYSSVIKKESSFNDSELFVLGAAWGRGGWFIYTDLAMSNGNEFIGGDTAFGDRLGANADDDWLTRVNVNFGYYF